MVTVSVDNCYCISW